MTAVATGSRPVERGTRPATATELPLTAFAELAFALVGLAAVIGLRRVFVGGEWFPTLALHVLAAHATVSALRRRRVDPGLAIAAAAAAGFLLIVWVHAGHHTTFGIPTGQTLDALTTAVGDAFAQFSEVKAPTVALDGFLIAAAAAVWTGAIIGDWAAFRSDATIEAVLPSASLFGIAAAVGADVDRMAVTGLWIAAVLSFVLLRRAERLGRRSTWVADRTGRGPRTLVMLGGLLAVAAVSIAAVLGPRLPGAESDAMVSLTDIGDGGPGTRVTVSPLVDIRSRLVNQADVEVFRVRSDVRAYWRLTSLDQFDGRIWSSNGSYGKTSGDLDDGVPVASDRISVRQDFQVAALSQIWLPAAYEPQSVDVVEPVRYDEVSGTLIVDTDVPTSDGTTYGVVSALPQHRPEALAAAGALTPQEIAERYLALPADFSDPVRQLAASLTAGSPSAYDAALRLQNFFRDEFTYDLQVGAGHSVDAIESFVFELRRGYCEQFAGSFAAMARSVGIPARVAVGFTPGLPDPTEANVYRVRGEHAHAWPEVFLGEYGWVAFEPTPGRGAPFAEQYTGVPEQQVESGGDPTTATTAPSPPSTEAPTTPTTAPQPFPDVGEDTGAAPDTDDEGNDASAWLARFAAAAGLLVLLVALYLTAVLAVTGLRRSRRRQAAVTPLAQVALAWEEALAAASRAGLPVRTSHTQSETAAELARRLPSIEAPVRTLAATVQDAAYAPGPPDAETAGGALALAEEIELRISASQSAGDRFRGQFHPRRLVEG